MRRYTKYESIQAMFDASPWKVESQEDFAAVPDAEWDKFVQEWDKFVQESTRFGSWKEMQEAAASEYLGSRLGLR